MKGITPRVLDSVFEEIYKLPEYYEVTIKVSIFEIYVDKIRDLLDLSKKNLKIRENAAKGVFLENITELSISDYESFFNLLLKAEKNRAAGETKMNLSSSRSHLIVQISVIQNNKTDCSVIIFFI